jgi:hypothetical protein
VFPVNKIKNKTFQWNVSTTIENPKITNYVDAVDEQSEASRRVRLAAGYYELRSLLLKEKLLARLLAERVLRRHGVACRRLLRIN